MAEFTRILLRQGPERERKSVILKSGEPVYVTDYQRFFIGDGYTNGGNVMGSKFLGICTFDEFSTEVFNVSPGYTGDLMFETSTNLLYVLSGQNTILGKSAYQIKTNYVSINKTPVPDNIYIYDNNGVLSLVEDSIDARFIAGAAIGRGLERNPTNSTIIQLATPSKELTFYENILSITDEGIEDGKLAPMPANTVKARLGLSGPPSNITLQDLAFVIKEYFASSGGTPLGVPIGTIIDFAGANPPDGYLMCDGRQVSIEEYPELYSAIGFTWGVGISANFFNIPNLNGRTTVGVGPLTAIEQTDSLDTKLGSVGGRQSVSLRRNNIPSHLHGVSFDIPSHAHQVNVTVPLYTGIFDTNNTIVNSFENYITIINGGPQTAPPTIPGGSSRRSLVRSTASQEILKHKSKIQEQVVNYVLNTYPYALSGYGSTTGVTLSSKCFRDSGYIIDSLAADILNDANHRSIETGMLYFSGYITSMLSAYPGSEVPTLPADQVNPTIEAIKSIGKFINGLNLNAQLSSSNLPVLSSSLFYTPAQNSLLDSLNNFTLVISNSANVPKTTPGGVISSDLYSVASNRILSYRSDIQLKVVQYVKSNFPDALSGVNLSASNALSAKCFRDTGFIVDSIAADLANNANHRSIETGVFYFSGAVLAQMNTGSTVPTLPQNQVNATIAAISAIGTFITDSQTGILSTGVYGSALNSDILNLVYTVYYPLSTGGNRLQYKPSGTYNTSTEKTNIANLLQNYKQYIQTVTTTYVINKNYLNFTQPVELAKCTRDVGYMVDAVVNDLATGVNAKSIQYAVAYWDGSTSRLPEISIVNQRMNTLDVINYLKSVCLTVVDDYIGLGENSLLSEINDLVDTMVYPLDNNGKSLDYNPIGDTPSDSKVLAAQIISQNRTNIQNQVIAYVDSLGILASRPDIRPKCYRDIGFMIDSIISDLTTGITSKSIQYALAYWSGSVNRIGLQSESGINQIPGTTATIRRLRDIILDLVEDAVYANKSTSTSTLTTTRDGAFSYNNTTSDGSAFGLNDSEEGFGDPHSNIQPSAVVNKIIKARG